VRAERGSDATVLRRRARRSRTRMGASAATCVSARLRSASERRSSIEVSLWVHKCC